MRYKDVMHTELRIPRGEGFDACGCQKDIEELQVVTELIAEEAGRHGWSDLKQLLDTAYNRLEEALWNARRTVDDPDAGGYYDDDDWDDGEEEDE